MHSPFLWITTRIVDSVDHGGTILQVTTMANPAAGVEPKRLSNLRSAASDFLDAHEGGTILMDCVDLLTLHNGVERVVRAIEDLHDDVTTKGGILIVFADPQTANPRLVAWLERELDEFPRRAWATAPDILVA